MLTGLLHTFNITRILKSMLLPLCLLASILTYSQTASSNRFKRIDYEYDLVSGKVNKVSYQKDSADQFIHQYSYDSDNRITKVETSSDNIVWDVDAKYFYYAHGPLARTEIGNDKVQGIDYAYTLQGWIKGVNSNTLDKKRDMGQDGKDTSIYDPSNPQLHSNFAQDAFGYSLNYFKGDYKAINQVRWNNATNRFEAVTTGSDLMASRHDLHNGNISSMVTTIVKPTITPGDTMQFVPLPQGTAYRYDQLNRLVEMKAWQNLNSNNNTWGTGLTYNGMYNNKFSYDANGNILTQLRKNASGTAINDLSYNRYNLAGKTMQNRLYMVDDAIGNAAFTDDIDDQGTFDNSTYNNVRTNNNYGYDEIGNMNRNNQKEIAQIKYTVYGKVKEVIRTSGSSKKNLKFDYDPSGNRIAKHVYNSSNVWEKTEYYVLDAQGNTMSVYKHEATGGTPPISFAQIERNIYGSSRIGSNKTNKELIGAFASTNLTHVIGNKQYDGVNHLGNVLVSFTDKRLPVDADNNSVVDAYWPEVVSANDYYPFGVKMKERSFASSNNRYQFNNKQYDDETETSDFGARIYESDLGIFLSMDKNANSTVWLSPYLYAENNPVTYIDQNGEAGVPAITQISEKSVQIGGKQWIDRYKFDYALNKSAGGGAWIYNKAKTDMGATSFGAALVMAFAAEEGDWGQGNDQQNTHNMFSLLSKSAKSKVGTAHGNVITYATWEDGFNAFKDLIDEKYSSFNDLLKKDVVTADDINKALISGNFHKQGGYTDSDKGKAIIGVLKYAITFRTHQIDNEIESLTGQINNLKGLLKKDDDKSHSAVFKAAFNKTMQTYIDKLEASKTKLETEKKELSDAYDKIQK